MGGGTHHGEPGGIGRALRWWLATSRTGSGRWWIVSKHGLRGPHEVRHDDPPGEDRSDERWDWHGSAPRWALVFALVASVGLNGLLGTVVVGLIVDRWHQIETAQKDPIWDSLAKLSQTQAEQAVRLRQHDDALHEMTTLSARMFDVQTEVRILNERLRRKGL